MKIKQLSKKEVEHIAWLAHLEISEKEKVLFTEQFNEILDYFNKIDEVRRQGFKESFIRMWEFYLAGSEAAFRFQNLMVFQIQLAKKVDSLPITRNYIAEREQELQKHDGDVPDQRRIAGK